MDMTRLSALVLSLFCLAVPAQEVPESRHLPSLADLIDTRVGTAAAVTRSAGIFGRGTEEYAHTLPAVLVPFGMNFWTPETRATERKGVCPYLYKDSLLRGFRCSHWIVGGCTQDYGSFTLSPTRHGTPLAFSHSQETARPYYYAVQLADKVKAEMTATERCGMLRFTFSHPDSAFVRLTVNSDEQQGRIWVDSLRGGCIMAENPCHRIYQGRGEPTGTSGWLCMTFDQPLLEWGMEDSQSLWLHFAPASEVCLKAACSFTGPEGAFDNLRCEMPAWDFEAVKDSLRQVWERKLGQITLGDGNGEEGMTQAERERRALFYGSLYRSSFLPHRIDDADGKYPQFANGSIREPDTQQGGSHYYDDFSTWDTFRAQHPLLVLLEPQRNGEMMQSLVRKYEQGGWLPIFPCWNSYTAAMIGDHCTSLFADACVKGLRNFNRLKAYEGARRNAFEQPTTYADYCNGMGRRALPSYLTYGYIPLEDSVNEAYHKNEQTSRTLEYAYDDFALAQMARSILEDASVSRAELERHHLSRKQLKRDYRLLMQRARNWQHVFNPHTGWVGGRKADGTFAGEEEVTYLKEPEKHPGTTRLTPTAFSTFITEGTPVHYSWFVPHDVKGLARRMGGRSAMEARLDSMFQRGWYWHGNEPCHQIAYLYSAIGRQDKTARAVTHLRETEYLNLPGGLSGNDDAGQMSAWYLFSSLGFYPLCPGTPFYYLGLPAFPHITLHLDGGRTFTIVTREEEAKDTNRRKKRDGLPLVKEVRLNGKKLRRPRIRHADIVRGGTLQFILHPVSPSSAPRADRQE